MERNGIQTHFALLDHRFLIGEDVFDRVFQSDDVLFLGEVDVLQHGRQRGGFAATRGAGHQDNAARGFGDAADDVAQTQFGEFRNVGFDIAHGQTKLAALLEYVGTETADPLHMNRKVHFALSLKNLGGVWRDNGFNDGIDPLFRGQRAFYRDQLSIDAENDSRADFNMYVGSAAFDGRL